MGKTEKREGTGESPLTAYMNECVPVMMDRGKPQDQAVAICIHMFDDWNSDLAEGEEPEKPPAPKPKRKPSTQEEAFDPGEPRDEQGRWTDGGSDSDGGEADKQKLKDQISEFADATKEKHGLAVLSMYLAHGKYLRLDQIIVPRKARQQGTGTRALEDITAFADQHDLPMSLQTAQKDPHHGTTSSARLKKFYKRFGFVENKGRWPEVSDNMVRPKQSDRKKAYDESEHPRDEHGRWTDAGDGGSGAPEGEALPWPRQPKAEQVWKWHEEIDKQLEQIRSQNPEETQLQQIKYGSAEEAQLEHMHQALGHFLRTKEEDKKSLILSTTSDDDGNLKAALSLGHNPDRATGHVVFGGGVTREAFADAIKNAVNRAQKQGIKRIDAASFLDDPLQMGAFEDAGFRKIKENYGIASWRFGPDETPEQVKAEADDAKARDQKVRDISKKVALDLDFPIGMFLYGDPKDPDKNFTLNGKQYMAAGIAYVYKEMATPQTFNKIKLWPEGFYSDKAIEGTTAHEIEHVKFQKALDAFDKERRAVMEEPPPPPKPESENRWERLGGIDAIMAPDGTLRPPYDKKYPAYTLMHEAFAQHGWDTFQKSDGVSDYSRDWWKQHQNPDTGKHYYSFRSAMHETLAEMAKAKYVDGKFPEHEGKTKKEKAECAKLWRNLYRAVDKVYHLE